MTAHLLYDLVGGLASHPSATARHLAEQLEVAVQREPSRVPHLLRLAAAWAVANARDAYGTHPHPIVRRALGALGF